MKLASLLLLTGLLLLSACEAPDDAVAEEATDGDGRIVDPLSCESGGAGCDMDWIINASPSGFPQNIELVINDKTIFNECKRDGNVGVNRYVSNVEVIAWDYIRLKQSPRSKFKLTINDLHDCNEKKTFFYGHVGPDYEVKQNNAGENYVSIKI